MGSTEKCPVVTDHRSLQAFAVPPVFFKKQFDVIIYNI